VEEQLSSKYSAAIHFPALLRIVSNLISHGRACIGEVLFSVATINHRNASIPACAKSTCIIFYLSTSLDESENAHFEASSAALIASQLAFASPNNILVFGA
jgi:hypothetical protein